MCIRDRKGTLPPNHINASQQTTSTATTTTHHAPTRAGVHFFVMFIPLQSRQA